MIKDINDTARIHQYLKERGPGFIFTPTELQSVLRDVDPHHFSAPLFHFVKEGRCTRVLNGVGTSGKPFYKYTVTVGINLPRKESSKRGFYTRNCKNGKEKTVFPVVEEKKSVDSLVSEAFDILVEISERSKNPLREFTDMQLLEELTRRQKRPGIEALVERNNGPT